MKRIILLVTSKICFFILERASPYKRIFLKTSSEKDTDADFILFIRLIRFWKD